jgi:hypothetical protein
MRLGFTGRRSVPTDDQRLWLISRYLELRDDVTEVHHGDCVGADEFFARLTLWFRTNLAYTDEDGGYRRDPCLPVIHSHPCDIEGMRAFTTSDVTHEVKPPMVRNLDVVQCSDLILALPSGQESRHRRSGTWATIRRARDAGVPVTWFTEGTETHEQNKLVGRVV